MHVGVVACEEPELESFGIGGLDCRCDAEEGEAGLESEFAQEFFSVGGGLQG